MGEAIEVPLYEFQCHCGRRFESVEKLGTIFKLCTKCKGMAKKVKYSRSNFSLQGTGWAKDGYRGG